MVQSTGKIDKIWKGNPSDSKRSVVLVVPSIVPTTPQIEYSYSRKSGRDPFVKSDWKMGMVYS